MSEIRDTHLPQVLAANPRPAACGIMAGTNDCWSGSGANFNLTASTTAYLDIITQLRAAGICPIIFLIPPNATSTLAQRNTLQWNARLRAIGEKYGVAVADNFSPVINPTTGGIAAAYLLGDGLGVHLNLVGRRVIAESLIAKGLPNLFPPAPQLTGKSSTDPLNLLAGQTWASFGNTANTVVTTPAPVAADDVSGNWQQAVYSGTSTILRFTGNVATGVVPGNRVAFSGRFQASGVEAAVAAEDDPLLIRLRFRAGTTDLNQYLLAVYQWAVDVADGTFYVEGTVPATADNCAAQVQLGPATAGTPITARWAELNLVDLTANAVLL